MIRQILRFIILLCVSLAATGAPGCFAAPASQPAAGTFVQADNDQSAGISNPDQPSVVNSPAPKIENSSLEIHNGNNPEAQGIVNLDRNIINNEAPGIENQDRGIQNPEAQGIVNLDRNIINNEAPGIENQDRGIQNPEAGQIFNADKFIFNRDPSI
jgi:hypothetical protein